MSKNQSRKGYVVGALVALVSTLFTVAPAQADANGPVTLLPTKGTTFNTIIGSPIELVSTQDPSTVVLGRANSDSYYIISNPDNARITITYPLVASGTDGWEYYTFDATTGASSKSITASTGVAISGSSLSAGMVITTTVSKIAISAWSNSGLAPIQLDAVSSSSTVTLKVQTLVDYATGDSTKNAIYNQSGFDLVSKEETVVLYSPAAVTATTTIRSLIPGGNTLSARVVYGNSVNPYFVAATTSIALFKDGTQVAFSDSAGIAFDSGKRLKSAITSSTTTSISAGVISFGWSSSTLTAASNVLSGSSVSSMSSWSAGIYSAQAYYGDVTVGAASVIWDASAGPTSLLHSVKPTFVNSTDANYSSSRATELLVRSAVKSITIGAQIYSSSTTALAASNVEIKAEISEGDLDATSTITATGAAGSLVTGGSTLVALSRTDVDGKTSFTINSTTGKKDDAITVKLYAKTSTGTWLAMTGAVDVEWQDAEFASGQFTAKPATYVSGANPTVTFQVTDQFGKGLDVVDGKALTVYAVASFGGVENATSYSRTVVVTGGKAAFTFANFAPAGGLAQLKATLFQGALNNASSISSTVVNVYNTATTDKVTVADTFAAEVTYLDYVTGDTSDPVVAKAVADAGLDAIAANAVATIQGNVLNATGVGQPGVAVTVAARGVLFLADGVYTLDTVTTNANEFGAFSVKAMAHTVHAKGTTVSITADGKSATTKLVTYLPDSLDDENLKFSWTLPATVVKNTTYAVTLSLTDKWGNPVQANDSTSGEGAVSIEGLGSVQVNSATAAVVRNFDRNGQITVFLRSIKDIAGPGSIEATLNTTGWNYPTGVDSTNTGTVGTIRTVIPTNKKSTAWDETLWSNELTSAIEVLDSAPAAAGKVNVGSFNGKLVVYAAGLNGARISWKVGGNWGSAVATSNYAIFNRPTPRAGVTVSVEVFVNGVKTLTKSVVTR